MYCTIPGPGSVPVVRLLPQLILKLFIRDLRYSTMIFQGAGVLVLQDGLDA